MPDIKIKFNPDPEHQPTKFNMQQIRKMIEKGTITEPCGWFKMPDDTERLYSHSIEGKIKFFDDTVRMANYKKHND